MGVLIAVFLLFIASSQVKKLEHTMPLLSQNGNDLVYQTVMRPAQFLRGCN